MPDTPLPAEPPIAVVLAVHNGAQHLRTQLKSLAKQSYRNWHLIATDDASDDASQTLLTRHTDPSKLTLIDGPQNGFAANFLNGLLAVPKGHWAAFCDQDDYWFTDKLERAHKALSLHEGPAFYTSGRINTDEALNPIKLQNRGQGSFPELLARGKAAGNTMVFNAAAVAVLHKGMPRSTPPFHDWWASLLLTGSGASWVHEESPSLFYRQHGKQVLGSQGGRVRAILNGTHRAWVSRNARALLEAHTLLTSESKALCETLVTRPFAYATLPIAAKRTA